MSGRLVRRGTACVVAFAVLFGGAAHAYSLQTVTSESCHEKLTAEGVDIILQIFPVPDDLVVPNDSALRRLLKTARFPNTEDYTLEERWVLLSLITGVRSPDTEGHSVLNLAVLRRLHADPAPRGQYAHALRGPDDDGLEGELVAVQGTIDAIYEELDEGFAASDDRVVARKPFYVDHYGQVDIPVILTLWHVGRAVHALQDAHAHMMWDAPVENVIHVLNYVDAVDGHLEDHRDGLAHSNALDDCNRDDTQPMVQKARERTTALLGITRLYIEDPSGSMVEAALERGFSPCSDAATDPRLCGWLVYNPPCAAAIEAGDTRLQAQVCCTADNNYCDSPHASVAKLEPVGPYLGCQASPGGTGGAGLLFALLLLAGVGRRLGARAGLPLLLLVGALAVPRPAAAESEAAGTGDAPAATAEAAAAEPAEEDPFANEGRLFVSFEGHGSALDDTVDAALLAPTFGFGVRVGWRWGRWRAGLLVDRNFWVPIEFGASVDPGALNIAALGEVLWMEGFVRTGLGFGTSTLVFDTQLDEAGSTGPFVEARPAGLRWNVAKHVHLVFDPISTAVVFPVTRDPPLRKLERRTTFGVEGTFF